MTTIKIYYCHYNSKDGMYYVDKSFPTKNQNKMKKSKQSTKSPKKSGQDKPTDYPQPLIKDNMPTDYPQPFVRDVIPTDDEQDCCGKVKG